MGFGPTPVELPSNLPKLYRQYVDNLAATLQDEAVSGAASDELHALIDSVVVSWDGDKAVHTLDVQGKLLEMLAKAKPAEEAGVVANGHSLKLVAGGRSRRSRRAGDAKAKTSAAGPAEASQVSLVAGARNSRFLRLVKSVVPRLVA